MTTELAPVAHTDPEQGHLLDQGAPAQVRVVDPHQHAGEQKHGGNKYLKGTIAVLLGTLAVVLFGFLAFAAQTSYGGKEDESKKFGFNAAGMGMFFFGLLFAVLQAVTAYTMWLHIAYHLPNYKHSSVLGPLKITGAVGFIAMGFASRHINLGALTDGSWVYVNITHAIEAFIIINWAFVIFALFASMTKVNWDCENAEDHKVTRRSAAALLQFDLSLILIGLLSAFFQLWTGGYYENVGASDNYFMCFAILFAVLQAISGLAMLQQCGHRTPGQPSETVHALLKVAIAFGLIAFGFACRSIYLSTHGEQPAPALFVAIQSFVIINFFVTLFLAYFTSSGCLCWKHDSPATEGKRSKGMMFGVAQFVFSVVLFGLLAGMYAKLTGEDEGAIKSLNAAGDFVMAFGLLFAVLEFFSGVTMIESSLKKFHELDVGTVATTSKVTLAVGALAFGFACRHINLGIDAATGSETPLVHAIESFIIINFFLTWLIDALSVRGKIEW